MKMSKLKFSEQAMKVFLKMEITIYNMSDTYLIITIISEQYLIIISVDLYFDNNNIILILK